MLFKKILFGVCLFLFLMPFALSSDPEVQTDGDLKFFSEDSIKEFEEKLNQEYKGGITKYIVHFIDDYDIEIEELAELVYEKRNEIKGKKNLCFYTVFVAPHLGIFGVERFGDCKGNLKEFLEINKEGIETDLTGWLDSFAEFIYQEEYELKKKEFKNKKDLNLYKDKRVFLFPDDNWKRVLELVPITTWRSKEDDCKRGYLTPDDICVYPSLVYHYEDNSRFDADSVLNFIKEYGADSVVVPNDLPHPMREQIEVLEENKVLNEGSTLYVKENQFIRFWEEYESIVYSEDDYATALMASVYASYLNAPLIIEGGRLDDKENYEKKEVICIGNVDIGCDDSFSLEELRRRYFELSGSNKIILISSDDHKLGKTDSLAAQSSPKEIRNLFYRNSLIAPFLASAKKEIILNISNNLGMNKERVKEELRKQMYTTIGQDVPFEFSCDVGDECVKGIKGESEEFEYVEAPLELQIPKEIMDKIDDVIDFNILGEFTCKKTKKSWVEFPGKHTDYQIICRTPYEFLNKPNDIRVSRDLIPDDGKVSLDLKGGEFIFKEKGNYYSLYYLNKKGELEEYLCSAKDGCSIKGIKSRNMKYYQFKDLLKNNLSFMLPNDNNFENFQIEIEVFIPQEHRDKIEVNIFVNDEILGNANEYDLKAIELNDLFIKKSSEKGNMNLTIGLTEKTRERMKGEDFFFYIKPTIRFSDAHPFDYLTLFGSEKAIVERHLERFDEVNDPIFKSIDGDEYAELMYDFDLYLKDLSVGRIKGFSNSDVSAMVARTLFFPEIMKADEMAVMTNAVSDKNKEGFSPVYYGKRKQVEEISNILKRSGIDVLLDSQDSFFADFSPQNWKNKKIIWFADHGNKDNMGIEFWEVPWLNGSLVFAHACSTCASEESSSFCNNIFRRGAVLYIGSVGISFTVNPVVINSLEKFLGEDISIGKAFSSSYLHEENLWTYGLYGDPSFRLDGKVDLVEAFPELDEFLP